MDAYYFISADGQQVGPVAGEQLLSYGVTPQTLVWGQNMSNWQPAETVAELATLFSSQPLPNAEAPTTTKAVNESSTVLTENALTTDDNPSAQQPHDDIAIVGADVDSTNMATNNTTKDATKKSKRRIWPYVMVIVLLAIATLALGVLYLSTNKNYKKEESSNSSLRSELSDVKNERDRANVELSEFKSLVSDTYPIIITNIEVANVYKDGTIETNYGGTIYDYCSMYLKPKITYTGLTEGNKEFKIKLYTPSGSVSVGSESYSGFTYSETVYVSSGESNTYELKGWGNESRGNWQSGSYRFEIWYGNTCLKSKQFRVY